MPVSDYECKVCGQVWEFDKPHLPETLDYEHSLNEELCGNISVSRVWSFRVGRGTSGNTPPR